MRRIALLAAIVAGAISAGSCASAYGTAPEPTPTPLPDAGTACSDAGSCQGVCQPGQTECSGNGVRTCDANGQWGAAAACVNQACVGGACEGVCVPSAKQCLGEGVQSCSASGQWDAPVACVNTTCVGASPSGGCQGVCATGQTKCSGNGLQACDANGQWGPPAACAWPTPACSAGACIAPPSCTGLAATCGPSGNESCCVSPLVTGGTFLRGYDGVTFTDSTSPATVSDFRLDKYEITVGRFRKFVAAWVAGWRPAYGTGKHMHLNGGSGLAAGAGYEGGWDAAWSLDMGTTSGDWNVKLSCDATFQTWTTAPGSNETRPVNCANWYEQHAFCIWDGGFLPSEAEWNYAAAGGSEQRVYPWGAADPGANASRAVFGCYYNGAGACSGVVNIAPVGSASAGDGKYGQSDLGGNIEEWTLDPFGLYPKPCTNCINATASSFRVAKDGSFAGYAYAMAASWHVGLGQADRYNALGARCARTP